VAVRSILGDYAHTARIYGRSARKDFSGDFRTCHDAAATRLLREGDFIQKPIGPGGVRDIWPRP